ncbi:hypothetical protein [Helicobacter sp. 11S03491-1]|uniref:hypothetical protein n=1 Tax=Helicobacter sp. 11S03491-1 TaxID=1476196 RepID=UPI000BA5BFD5|nr:hypothetical protein [Helicobacter sp. 11S03491-1]PAF42568.1 hypothetical protein BKH45_03380 [Helicobacter sp. 11S03491-1]
MKSSQNIISIIRNKTQFKKLQTFNELNKLKLFLPLEMRKAVASITCKNNKLLFAFTQPGFVNEFNHYNSKDIKESLKIYQDLFPSIKEIHQIQAYVPKNILSLYTQPICINTQVYHEHSRAHFKNLAMDDRLKEQFESIREIILKNLNQPNQID